MGLFSVIQSLGICLLLSSVNGRIFIPDEVASLISIAYANIPPTKIGTDSRVGFGFQIGPNADGQVLLELGPQRDTQPLGPDSSKRETKIESKNLRSNRKVDVNSVAKENSLATEATKNTNLETLVGALTKWLQTVAAQQNDSSINTTETRTRVLQSSP